MDPDAWLVTVGDGIMEACSVLWVYKHLPLRDWLAYSEKFGMPYLLGKTQAIFNSAEWQAMAAALRGFGSDGAAVVGGADDIVPVPMGAGSETTPFPGLVERSERAMSILWRGADLGTQAHSGTGQGQGASLQADETQALDEDRAAWLTESLAAVSRTAIRYLFGEGVPPLAYVRLRTEVRRDIQLDLAVDAFLLSNGAPVGVADVLARYNRPTPGADEPLLRPPAAAGGGDGGGGARGAASEDATRASLERAANGAEACVATGNFHPNHDKLGRFTTKDGAVATVVHEAPITQPQDNKKKVNRRVSTDAFRQKNGTGHCTPAVVREAIFQIWKQYPDVKSKVMDEAKAQGKPLQLEGQGQVPLGTIENDIRQTYKKQTFNFSDTGPGSGLGILDTPRILAKYGVDSQQIDVDQIKEHLEDGPVLVATTEGLGHAKLILSMDDDGSFNGYNPLTSEGRATISQDEIIPSRVLAVEPFSPAPPVRNGSSHRHPQ